MTWSSYYRDSVVRKDLNQGPDAESPVAAQTSVDAGIHCAYNQTRERFLSADVDAADFSAVSLDARLPKLEPNSGAGLWLIPFRGISPTSVRVPVDLVYLDARCKVIETVESFPITRASSSSPSSASVLVLPADAIRSTETRKGDQLVLCSPDEMKRLLQRLAEPSDRTSLESPAASATEMSLQSATGRLLQWEDRSRFRNPADTAPVEDAAQEGAALVAPAPPAEAIEPVQKTGKPAKGWLQRLLSPDPPQPRKAQRECLSGLVVHFFTGGAPVAHGVRDISLTGMYVLTAERWYLGTMVRMTLTDRMEPTTERSITLNATVVRWGNDGVGLKFVLQNSKDRHRPQADGMIYAADKMQIERFLQRLRGA